MEIPSTINNPTNTKPRMTTTLETPAVLAFIQPPKPESSGTTVITISTVEAVSPSSRTDKRMFLVPGLVNTWRRGSSVAVLALISFVVSPSSSSSSVVSKSQKNRKLGMSDGESVVSLVQITNSSPTVTVSFSGVAAALGRLFLTVIFA